ncbi:hypothetical protein Pla100_63320 [Neorhodopirellula pilleata]|uniref:Uncharacterized protein n=2 Tax=Neorhodopirellula pilleata TaxID=2714738 RepID=A0A5C5YQN1_9BACT|nr:hypothetical protein Pla100_63320 [Neorhodopirellula pilleata]
MNREGKILQLIENDSLFSMSSINIEREFKFAERTSWLASPTTPKFFLECLELLREDDTKPNPWNILHSRYFGDIESLVSSLGGLACGPKLQEIDERAERLGELLSNCKSLNLASQKIAEKTGADANELYDEILADLPYVHFNVMVKAEALFPDLVFPVLDVMFYCYENGGIPFGVYGQQMDPNYVGPLKVLYLSN